MISVRNKNGINTLHAEIVSELKNMLDDNNVLVTSFRMANLLILDNMMLS
ncbi:hypothetical protein C2S53_002085 [Perilla frutescens var. hirtella]|uniref:Uncharacterized protein n=1 Tax=Perilla frutescens var. hirtella TaxID=608512 RepID=A0AAD4JLK4_PERFH|nr:hypothetical protein C2S51_037539 [Perilla frutescens var. frutescens]KAH6836105.1 hypothetical protein C2S53_002085 [Perilla frutescens var. hirtella]